MKVLEMHGVSKTYGTGDATVHALLDVDLSVEAGAMVAVMGPSGSGKSTLLTIAGSLEEPDRGEVLVGEPGRPLGQAQPGQGLHPGRPGLARGHAVQFQREGDVLGRSEPGQQVEVLEDVADGAAPQPGLVPPRHPGQ